MTCIRTPRPWELPAHRLTDEADYWNRRKFLQAAGLGAIGGGVIAGGLFSGRALAVPGPMPLLEMAKPDAKTFNNFVEFSQWSGEVPHLAKALDTESWPVTISGLVENPAVIEADEFSRLMPLEERAYRFRCVEGWAMVVPWVGFPLNRLLKLVRPKSSARYVRFSSFYDPESAPGQKQKDWHVWPYTEAISLAEAANELTFLATGVYGQTLPKEQGAPLRLVVPWKYATKNIKSITKIEFIADRPDTFWMLARSDCHDFECNVLPDVRMAPSRTEEVMIGSGERHATLPYNGYGEFVASLYRG